MKAEKVTVTIHVESLSIDALRGLLTSALEEIEAEAENGELSMSDGDLVKWTTVRKSVEF
jgi:hypothetical protein